MNGNLIGYNNLMEFKFYGKGKWIFSNKFKGLKNGIYLINRYNG